MSSLVPYWSTSRAILIATTFGGALSSHFFSTASSLTIFRYTPKFLAKLILDPLEFSTLERFFSEKGSSIQLKQKEYSSSSSSDFNSDSLISDLDEPPKFIFFPSRISLSTIYSIGYAIRNAYVLTNLLQRPIPMDETVIVGAFVFFFDTFNAILSRSSKPSKSTKALSICLYSLGAFMGPYYEHQRMVFKSDPLNKGHLYTQGFGQLVRHPNYLADLILLLGWGLASPSNSMIHLLVPLLSWSGFQFEHIPHLTSYLTKYPEFPDYLASTPALFPTPSSILSWMKS